MTSPCIDVCKYDEATGWCYGCGLLKKEKKVWKKEPASHGAIAAALPSRILALAQAGHVTGNLARKKKKK